VWVKCTPTCGLSAHILHFSHFALWRMSAFWVSCGLNTPIHSLVPKQSVSSKCTRGASASKSALSLVGQVRTFALFSLYTLYRECILSLLRVECTDALLVSPYSSMESRVHSWVKCTFMCKYVYSHHIYIYIYSLLALHFS